MKGLCHITPLLIIVVILSTMNPSSCLGQATMTDYCNIPPFVSTSVPPNVMIMLSIETPMQGAMYPDITCTGDPAGDTYGCNPSTCRTTFESGRNVSRFSSTQACYNNTTDYNGYFDPHKCYTYTGSGASGRFEPSTTTSNHQCSSAWSGNFLNWATMMAIDGFRKSMTGGNREGSPDSSSTTILLGGRQTLGTGDSWFPMKKISDYTSFYIPYTGTKYIVRHANGFSVCNAVGCTVKESGTGEARFPTTTGATSVDGAYNLRIKVCDTGVGLESNCNTSNNKPEGLLQHYARAMRFGLISYAMRSNADLTRDGGIIRANMKWITNKIPYGLKYHDSGGSVVECTDPNGCTNPEAEINTDGTFKNNPDNVTGATYSGVINYINKFAYANGYKSYDPISEMFYEIVRYFKNLGPSTNKYCQDITSLDDGFPAYCSPVSGTLAWRDPYIYSCQHGVVLGINDANPWCDKRIPGTAFTTSGSIPGATCSTDYGQPSNADTSINVTTWTNKVGKYEFGSSITMKIGCVKGGACDWTNTTRTFSNLGEVAGTSPYAHKENSYYIAGLAYYAHTQDIRSDLTGRQSLTTYVIDTQEAQSSMLVGRKSMLFLAAKYGGFDNTNGINTDGDEVPDLDSEWKDTTTGFPKNYLLASSDPSQIEIGFTKFFLDILGRASSGTAASVLSSSEGSGANILQTVFYPKRLFGTTAITWTGEMQNLWYYIDPFLQNSNIREDTVTDKKLHLIDDNVIQFWFDSLNNETKANKYSDTDGDGAPNSFQSSETLDQVKSLWEVGGVLWSRNLGSSPRTIYTTTTGAAGSTFLFSTANASTLQSYLQAGSLTEAQDIINYVHGVDKSGYRSRNVTIGASSGVWKFGDIINSTPRLQSFMPLNNYHLLPPNGYMDVTYSQFISQDSYNNRGMAYVGGNDGMLHAFFLGNLKQDWSGKGTYEKAFLDGSDLAKELWAFIPKNSLPYLKYMTDPDYCHLYFVDAPNFLLDASIEGSPNDTKTTNSWKTILIGGMGMGGACRKTGDSCTDCIKTPTTDPSDSTQGLGYSSYFAIDVTDPNSPVLLWEFSHPELGMSTSGPAIIRIGNSSKNGNWFVIFASGPTGPINTGYHQFLSRSDQQLRLFVLDLKTGTLQREVETGILNAFGGSLYNAALDTDRGDTNSSGHYSDDVFYLGYTKCADSPCTTSSTWTKGGVLRVITKENPDPGQWVPSIVVDNLGPVTAAVTKLQDRKNGQLWLSFGSGRFYYKLGTTLDDPGDAGDPTTLRALYGVQEPCYSSLANDINNECSVAAGALKDQTSSPSTSLGAYSGWYINLDAPSSTYKQERVITDPLAVFSGVIFFTTFSPSSDACALGGNTYIWAVDYKSGAQPSALLGKALLQVSTGEIKELTLASAFSQKEGRRSVAISGVPPKGQGLSVLISPRPLRRILHIQEK